MTDLPWTWSTRIKYRVHIHTHMRCTDAIEQKKGGNSMNENKNERDKIKRSLNGFVVVVVRAAISMKLQEEIYVLYATD